jgi:formyltetrahydrofolate synthetase
LQPDFGGIFGIKPSATRRSDSSALPSDFFVLHHSPEALATKIGGNRRLAARIENEADN